MAVKGGAPVTFISESTSPGKQYQIPLSSITISSGAATCDAAWLAATGVTGTDTTNVIPTLLNALLAQGLIAPA